MTMMALAIAVYSLVVTVAMALGEVAGDLAAPLAFGLLVPFGFFFECKLRSRRAHGQRRHTT